MSRIACFFAALLFSAASFAQNYTGTFTSKNAQGGLVTLTLKQDGQKVAGTLAGNNANFKVEGTVNAEGLYGTVTSDGGKLLIAAQVEGDKQLKVVLAEPLPNGQPNMEAARRLVFARAGAAAAQSNPMSPAPNRALNGTWSVAVDGQPLVVVFEGTGAGKVNGKPMRWQTQGTALFVEQQGQPVLAYQYQLQGEKLSVSGGDLNGVVVFTRGTAAADAAKGGKAASGGGGAQELVGKWCKGSNFSANSGGGSSRMTCFELRGDGSYLYNSEGSMSAYGGGAYGATSSQSGDAGRWRLEGNRLVAQSQRGTTSSYALEKRNHPKNRNDPMICLDGDCYTTAWRKAPW